jgi:hypothetical protein
MHGYRTFRSLGFEFPELPSAIIGLLSGGDYPAIEVDVFSSEPQNLAAT